MLFQYNIDPVQHPQPVGGIRFWYDDPAWTAFFIQRLSVDSKGQENIVFHDVIALQGVIILVSSVEGDLLDGIQGNALLGQHRFQGRAGRPYHPDLVAGALRLDCFAFQRLQIRNSDDHVFVRDACDGNLAVRIAADVDVIRSAAGCNCQCHHQKEDDSKCFFLHVFLVLTIPQDAIPLHQSWKCCHPCQ